MNKNRFLALACIIATLASGCSNDFGKVDNARQSIVTEADNTYDDTNVVEFGDIIDVEVGNDINVDSLIGELEDVEQDYSSCYYDLLNLIKQYLKLENRKTDEAIALENQIIQMFKSIELIRELSEELGMPSGFVEEIENCDFSEAYLEENGLTIIMNLGDEGYSKQVCISGLGTEDYLPYKILMYALGFYLSSNDPKLDNVICELSRCSEIGFSDSYKATPRLVESMSEGVLCRYFLVNLPKVREKASQCIKIVKEKYGISEYTVEPDNNIDGFLIKDRSTGQVVGQITNDNLAAYSCFTAATNNQGLVMGLENGSMNFIDSNVDYKVCYNLTCHVDEVLTSYVEDSISEFPIREYVITP